MSELEKPTTAPEMEATEPAGPSGHAPPTEQAPRGTRAAAILRWLLIAGMALAAFASLAWTFHWFDRGSAGASAGATIYYCPMHPSVKQDHPGECPICSMTLVPLHPQASATPAPSMGGSVAATADAGSDAYYCPMHPNRTSADPQAKCPDCGMKMEPKPTASTAPQPANAAVPGLVAVDLSPERIQLMGMRTARVTREPMTSELRTVGLVTANEKQLSQVQTRFTGWIQTLAVSQTGQRISKGEVVATIYSPDLLAAQEEYLNALRWEKSAGPAGGQGELHGAPRNTLTQGLAEDARARLELLGVTRDDLAQIQRTGKPVREFKVRSPVTGVVVQRDVVQGTYVQPGTPLVEIANLSTVWVLADVYESEVTRVRDGLDARLSFASFPGEVFRGKVAFVFPTINPGTRTLRLRIELDNKDLRLKPGMYGDVVLATDQTVALVVPSDAIVDTGELQYVFVAREGGRFEPRRVLLGARTGERIEVSSGVAEGELVVTKANFLIDSESRLRSAILGDSALGGQPSAGAAEPKSACDDLFDRVKYPDKYTQCRSCEVQHRGMGSMEADCRSAIPKPWK